MTKAQSDSAMKLWMPAGVVRRQSRLSQQRSLVRALVLLILCGVGLQGCASKAKWQRYQQQEQARVGQLRAQAEDNTYRPGAPDAQVATSYGGLYVSPMQSPTQAYQATRQAAAMQMPVYQAHNGENINHYVQGMMHDLIAGITLQNPNMIVGVTSFVYLDGPYDQTDLIGNQLSESFMHEVHQFGLNVVDFKTTDYIRVTPQGDFVFSRDFMELREEQPIEVILGGTMVKHQGGMLVNARIVGVSSKKVMATAQGFIPAAVVQHLHSSQNAGSLRLKQGE